MGIELMIIIWLVAFIVGLLVGVSINRPRNMW
jgi:hypothetical protein